MVTGAKGMLGTDAVALFHDHGHEVVGVDLGDLELTDGDAVKAALGDVDVMLNCAAWTAVDDAETREDDALLVNGTIPGVLAQAAAATDAAETPETTKHLSDASLGPDDKDATAEAIERATAVNGKRDG